MQYKSIKQSIQDTQHKANYKRLFAQYLHKALYIIQSA